MEITMYYEEESGATGFIAGILVGAVIGASVALLTTPQSGKTLRARIIRRDAAHDVPDDDELDRDAVVAKLKRRRRRSRA
jgi:gas vesicle protein